jgi:hypothetical protein
MAVNKRDLNTLTGETGWPIVNYAQEERNFQTSHNGRAGALSIPRFKFTFLVEFQLSPRALDNPVTNLREFVSDTGKLYTHLVSIDHPSPTIKIEKLRSYNKWITIPTQVEYPQASMTFHDDSTSVVQALWKENLNFYTHQATIGDTVSGIDVQSNLGSSKETNSFQFTEELTATDGGEMRSAMGRRPSLGMRLKPNDGRHFFESIVIYDLGTEPDAINVYWYHHPMITGWAHDNLDKEDRTGNVRVQAAFDYEGYYFTVGQNRGRLADYIQHILGAFPEGGLDAPRKDGIARDGLEAATNRPVEIPATDPFPDLIVSPETAAVQQSVAAARPFSRVIEPALESELGPVIPESLAGKQSDLEQTRLEQFLVKQEMAKPGVSECDPDPFGNSAGCEDRLAELDEREEQLVDAIRDQKKQERVNRAERVDESETSALENTESATGVDNTSPDRTGPEPESAQIYNPQELYKNADVTDKAAQKNEDFADRSRTLEEAAKNRADGYYENGDTKSGDAALRAADRHAESAGFAERMAARQRTASTDLRRSADNAEDQNTKNASLPDPETDEF